MALDFSRINKTLEKSKSKGEQKDFSKIYFKPKAGLKQKVRIVPYKGDKTFPVIEVQMHKYDTFKKFIPTLNNFGEVDPILKFRKAVYDDVTSTKEEKDYMKNLSPRVSNFVQVIVRGEEELGVRLWDLNKTNLETVLAILGQEEEYGDITDIVEGRDLTIDGYTAMNEKSKKTYTAVTITVAGKTSPLAADKKLVEKWLTDQYEPVEQYKRYTADELKKLLDNFLNPADGSEDPEEETKPEAPRAPAKPPVASSKPVFTKTEEVIAATTNPESGDQTPAKPAAKKPAAKKPVPVVEPEDGIDDLEDQQQDELAEAIPPVAEAKPTPKPKPAAPKTATKAPSVMSRFQSAFDEDDD